MTSYVWKDGNVYGERVEPRYNAISYTWGRWQLRGDELPHVRSLEVKGVTWSIPRIDPEHFSVPDFKYALQVATGSLSSTNEFELDNVEYLWLDITCIDQTNGSPEMSAEIGRQAKIFKGAYDVVVWLNRLTHTTIECLESDLMRSSDLLSGGKLEDELTSSNIDGVHDMVRALRAIKADPWFSSLWTLQEAFLRQDAYVLTREAATICHSGHAAPTPLKGFIQLFEVVKSVMIDSPALKELDQGVGLVSLIDEFGFADFYLEFPMILLAASQHLQTGPYNREDRVYGIMQVFDLQLGKSNPSADPTRHYTLNELEDELGQALLEIYPVMSQMHCHASQPDSGKAWRMGHHSTIPRMQSHLFEGMSSRNGEIEARASFGTQRVHGELYGTFTGPTKSFHDLLQNIKQHDSMAKPFFPEFLIALDATHAITPEMRSWPWNEKQHELGALLDTSFPILEVLRFGKYAERDLSGLRHGKPVILNPKSSVGLLMVPQEARKEPVIWHRRGLCLWKTKLGSVNTPATQHVEGITPVEDDLEWSQTHGYWG